MQSIYGIAKKYKTNTPPAQKLIKAIDSTTDRNFKYMAGKLCDLISTDQINLTEKPRIRTPFTGKDQGVLLSIGQGYIVNPEGTDEKNIHDVYVRGGRLSSYNSIANAIHGNYKKEHLQIIYDYLSIPYMPEITTLNEFNSYIANKWPTLTTDFNGTQEEQERARKSMNYLSAILMIAEPFRFLDQGRLSRAFIRRMYKEYEDFESGAKPNTPSKSNMTRGAETASLMTQKYATKEIKAILEEPDKHADAFEVDNIYISDDESDKEEEKQQTYGMSLMKTDKQRTVNSSPRTSPISLAMEEEEVEDGNEADEEDIPRKEMKTKTEKKPRKSKGNGSKKTDSQKKPDKKSNK